MRISLNGTWRATDDLGLQARAGKPGYDAGRWREVRVPGHWQQVPGLENHTGRLLYRHSFSVTLSPGAKQFARLHFDGVFSEAKVWLNGAFVGEHRGYFVPESYDVTRHLRHGENVVMVEVDAPPDAEPRNRQQVTGLFGQWDAKPPGREPGGIWRDVYLEIGEGLVAERLRVQADLDRLPPAPLAPDELGKGEDLVGEGPVTASVGFDLEFMSASDGRLSWTAVIQPETFSGQEFTLSGTQPVRRGWNRMQSSLSMLEPRLWWTWDRGRPDLYRLILELAVDGGAPLRLERLFGVRKVELRSWHLYLNGRRLFVRGTQYGPPDFFLATCTPETYRRDFDLIQEAHINLVRVRAHVDRPELYEEASRRGILLWQDLPLQGLYGRTAADEARRLAAAMVDLLGHWPAIGLWCAHADPVRPVDANDPSVLDRSLAALSRVTGNYNMSVLAPAVRDVIRTQDPSRPCLVHPGEWGGGDNRLYLGWSSGRVQELDRTLKLYPEKARFVSEFGAQSFPGPEHSRSFVRGTWPGLNWAELQERFMLQPRLLERNVPQSLAARFEQYVEATQRYQAELCRRLIERMRRLKYAPCGGVMTYLFADGAPGITWSLVDYWREPKLAYQAVRSAFRPITVLADWPAAGYAPGARITLPVYLVNDSAQNESGSWSWSLERLGETVATQTEPAYLPPDRVVAVPGGIDWWVPEDELPGALELILCLTLDGQPAVRNSYSITILPAPNP